MGKPRFGYAPRPDVGPEEVRIARARAWQFIFDCHAKKKAGEANAGGGTKGPEHDHPAERILPR